MGFINRVPWFGPVIVPDFRPLLFMSVARSLAQCAARVDCGPYGWAISGAQAVAHEHSECP
jgi:hypothetical protein